LRSSGLRVERPGLLQRKRCGLPDRSTSPVLGRHYRVYPQRLVVCPITSRPARNQCGAKSPSVLFGDGKDDLSLGVRTPSAFEPGRSLCRFTSPTPSALRVSHSLSGLSPPGPCGSVSRHIRPWGLFTVSRAFPVRPAVTPLDVRCPLAVPVVELSLVDGRLQGVAPVERPFSGARG
jgi:hypothetical protein